VLPEWNFAFHGQFSDSETGWVNYGFRYYVPLLGRWLGRDPIEERSGLNILSSYANSPVTKWDLLGLIYGLPDHHWAIQDGEGKGRKGQEEVNKYCEGFDIDDYTTTFTTDDHLAIHNEFEYNRQYKEMLEYIPELGNCCSCCFFMVGLAQLRRETENFLRERNGGPVIIAATYTHPWGAPFPDTTAKYAAKLIRECYCCLKDTRRLAQMVAFLASLANKFASERYLRSYRNSFGGGLQPAPGWTPAPAYGSMPEFMRPPSSTYTPPANNDAVVTGLIVTGAIGVGVAIYMLTPAGWLTAAAAGLAVATAAR
jgi:RHS repeat-associated protein